MGLGKKIGDQIQQQNLSLRDFSRKANVPYSTLYAIVNRDNDTVKPEILKKISTALEVPTSVLTGNSLIFETTLADCEINKILAKVENKDPISKRERILLQDHIKKGVSSVSGKSNETVESLQELHLLNPFYRLNPENKQKVIAYAKGLLDIQTAEDEIK